MPGGSSALCSRAGERAGVCGVARGSARRGARDELEKVVSEAAARRLSLIHPGREHPVYDRRTGRAQ